MFSSKGESTNIVKVDTSVVDITYYLFHDLLGKVRDTFESHREMCVFVFAKGHDNDTKLLAWFVYFT